MNNLYYINQPPFYIAYSNCLQRRWWQPLLLPHTCLVWHCLFSMHTIASNTLEQLWVNQKDIDMENMLMAFLLSGPGTKSLRRHFWLKSRITFFSWVWGIPHFNILTLYWFCGGHYEFSTHYSSNFQVVLIKSGAHTRSSSPLLHWDNRDTMRLGLLAISCRWSAGVSRSADGLRGRRLSPRRAVTTPLSPRCHIRHTRTCQTIQFISTHYLVFRLFVFGL